METRKGVQYFKVKWVDIAPAGSTWEPASHFIGDPAKAALLSFRQKRAADQAAVDAARAELRAGKQSGTDDAGIDKVQDTSKDDELCSDETNAALVKLQFRKKHSDVSFSPQRGSKWQQTLTWPSARCAASTSRP